MNMRNGENDMNNNIRKEAYERPSLEVILFETEDVITTSIESEDTDL